MTEHYERNYLDSAGWKLLDKTVVSLTGEIRQILSSMQDIVFSEPVTSSCKDMGIASTAFLYHDLLTQNTRFYEKGKTPETYGTRYLWGDGCTHEKWSRCLQWLFETDRTIKINSRDTGISYEEDYFVNLPCKNPAPRTLSEESEWKENYKIHYCTVGEIIYTCFVWRALSMAFTLGQGDLMLDKLCLEMDALLDGQSNKCLWRDRNVLDPRDNAMYMEELSTFSDFWSEIHKSGAKWRDVYTSLLLDGVEDRDKISNRAAVIKFLSVIHPEGSHIPEDVCLSLLNNRLSQSIERFVCWVGFGDKPRTVSEALFVVETSARFPILPYYYWNAVNRAPMCYLVTPVWTSQNYSIEVPAGKCHQLGVSLTAVVPLVELDWTLIEETKQRSVDIPVRLITDYLRLMARPLVENNLYAYSLKELEEKLKEQMTDQYEKVLHKHANIESEYARLLKELEEKLKEQMADLFEKALYKHAKTDSDGEVNLE